MTEKIEPLSGKDMNTISDVILNLVYYYKDLPFKASQNTVQWQNLCSTEGIGLYSLQGAVYISKYVSGNYTAQLPFRIVYKCNSSTNKLRISKQTFVEQLSAWLEECSAELVDKSIQIECFERTSQVYKIEAGEDGYEQYTCTMNLKYFYKKG